MEEAQMSALKKMAFAAGFVIGLAGFVLVASNVLLYLLTGKLLSVEVKADGRPVATLMSPEQVVDVIREQVEKGKAQASAGQPGIGKPH
jgi:hypothetical protein